MTTFNLRSKDLEEATETIKAVVGRTPKTNRMQMRQPVDDGRSAAKVSIDMSPDNTEPHRGGTRGVGRGAMRGGS